MEITKFLRTAFSIEHLWWLFLIVIGHDDLRQPTLREKCPNMEFLWSVF